MKRWGIRQRALFLALAPASLIALLLAFYFINIRFSDLEQSLEERGVAIARQLAPASEYGVFAGNRYVLQKLAESALLEADVKAVVISDRAGAVLARSGESEDDTSVAPSSADAMEAGAGGGRVLVFEAPIMQNQVALEDFAETDASRPARIAPAVIGTVRVEISRDQLIARKNRLLLHSLLITLGVLLITVFTATRLSRGITRPISRLAETVEKIGAGDLDARVIPDSGGSLGALESGVNAMAVALRSARDDLQERISAATMQLASRIDEAERANQSKSRFLAAASHDLRQPLHALGLFVAELRGKAHSVENQALIGRIDASVVAMEELLDALLDISRLDAGVITPRIREFPIAELLSRLERECVPAAREKWLKMGVVPCAAWIRSDPVLLERILRNLLSNALRYTVEGGVVLGCRRCGRGGLRIEIWDSGCGIPEASQKDIFQEFFQVENAHREQQKGLGLGLAIVDRLAHLLHHRITLISAPGVGSRFAVDVPRASPAGARAVLRPAEVAEAGPDRRGALVVVVDDQALVRDGMQGLLSAWGYEVVVAGSGDEAETQLQNMRAPEALICDYRLHGAENGLQLATRLRGKYASETTPCILISGDTAPSLVREVAAAGCRLMHKPVRPATLRSLLAGLLATRQKIDAG